jgi:AbrB family looped-hinge helix DNA binding protein
MHATLSSKGQVVLPAPLRRQLGMRSRSKLLIEERDGGIFIRLARSAKSPAPIDYLPPGAIKLSERDYELERLAGPDEEPGT